VTDESSRKDAKEEEKVFAALRESFFRSLGMTWSTEAARRILGASSDQKRTLRRGDPQIFTIFAD
jgi:hypothetical protein